MVKRYNKVLITYENDECINYLFLCKHSDNLDELKYYISKVMETRKVYNYNIKEISETNEGDIENIKRWCKSE